MSRRRLSPTELTTIIVAVVGTLATIATAYFAFRGTIAPAELALHATQSAEAKITDSPSLVPSLTTLPSATSVPTATETLLPPLPSTEILESPVPTSVILFSDSFDTNANGWLLGMREIPIARLNKEITDGTLQLDIVYSGKGYGWITAPDFRAENFYISVDAKVVQFSNRSIIGVVILFRISNGGNSAYAIEFRNDGTYGLYSSKTLRQDGLWRLVHEENSDAFQVSKDKANNFGVRVQGQQFTAYADGKELFTFEDNSIRGSGDVGLGFSGESGKSAIVLFDNLLITK
jgi:hypothetical protein